MPLPKTGPLGIVQFPVNSNVIFVFYGSVSQSLMFIQMNCDVTVSTITIIIIDSYKFEQKITCTLKQKEKKNYSTVTTVAQSQI